jgi:hypothetical protein
MSDKMELSLNGTTTNVGRNKIVVERNKIVVKRMSIESRTKVDNSQMDVDNDISRTLVMTSIAPASDVMVANCGGPMARCLATQLPPTMATF